MSEKASEFQAAYDAGVKHGSAVPELREIDGLLVAIWPGGKIENLEDYQNTRIIASPLVSDASSFLVYVNRFRRGETIVFAAPSQARVVAAINYHGPDVPSRGGHTLILQLCSSPAWQAWKKVDKQQQSQVPFAEFLEEHVGNIVAPDAAEVLEAVQHLEGTKSVAWTQSRRLSDGRTQLSYVEEIEARAGQKGEIEVPRRLKLRMPVYEHGVPVEIEASLRFRINGDKLFFAVVLREPQAAEEAAFNAVLDEIRKGFTGPVLLGTP